MASSYSTSLFLELMETGANASTWGTNTNNNLKIVDAYSSRVSNVTVTSGTVNVASANASASLSSAANKVLQLQGTLTGDAIVTIPNVNGNYLISTMGMVFDGNTLKIAPYGHTSNFSAITQDSYSWIYVANNTARNGFSNFGNMTVSGDISNVTGNVLVTGTVNVVSNATFNANVSLQDSDYLLIGTGDDLQLYHDGTNSYIKDTGTGAIRIQGSSVELESTTGENMFVGTPDGAVTLYYDNVAKFATTATGTTITGEVVADGLSMGDNDKILLGTSDDLEIYHDASNSWLLNSTGSVYIRNNANDSDVIIQSDDGSGGTTNYIIADGSIGEVRLFYYGAEKLNTTSTGITVTGDVVTSDGTIGNIAVRNLIATSSTASPSGGSNGDFYIIHDA